MSPVRLIPADERQQKHRDLASGLRPAQEKRRKNVADQRAAKKAYSTVVESKQIAPKTEPKLAEESMDVDLERSSVLQTRLD